MLNPSIKVIEEVPGAKEYCSLRVECGLSPKTVEAAEVGLPRSLFSVCLRDAEGSLVAMGRIVGDGLHVQVVDIAVSPKYHKQGLSRTIMEKIKNFIDTQIPKCAVASLFADVDWLYQKFGFEHPKNSVGMLYKREVQIIQAYP